MGRAREGAVNLFRVVGYALTCIGVQVATAAVLPERPPLDAVGQLAAMPPAVMLATLVAGALVEEALVRGVLWWPLRRLGAVPAIVATSAAFAALHGLSDPIHGVMALGPGVVLGIARERHGWTTAAGAHVMRNLVAWAALSV